ncbi:MAG: bifunctional hydroxymethylpyrimidine kinase/phosphomethylpyrimidine kinase [Liquorilactobacillus nagelii]|uniref:bifunctional hydroxymethylpyrimidine kinase/phosphomethylpyrimidine kinase n=1 Tax=Liquorilactobacillus nagelii TaxID=82688 RepID=UPI00242A54D8|nr:bifunctional hydroxymethylpyrimidine kinase/phosphomethylpyrimidine kinase [Liquorilactobacillus nagelii]MCI1633902.1 bifunctional hydroxymethylpyrimidine kinase/phosphomethylpyrimidine kinase [Liquorilactobacillus nagelii]
MENPARILLTEDFSAVGQLSTTAALPLLSAFKVPLAILPSSLLSTQSEGFGTPISLSTTEWAAKTLEHWKFAGIQLSGSLIGYFAEQQFGELLLSKVTVSQRLTLLDPVMADNGCFYPAITSSHVKILQKLLARSLFCTPNLTEACFLLNQPYVAQPTEKQLADWLQRLQEKQLKGGKTVITGITLAEQTGCVWLEAGQLQFAMYPNLAGHFYGSGDVFAALLFGLLWQKVPWSTAIKLATFFLHDSLKRQVQLTDIQRRFGIELGPLLVKIENFLVEKADNHNN